MLTRTELQAIREWNNQIIRDLADARFVELANGTQQVEFPDLDDYKITIGYIKDLVTEVERLQAFSRG